jgi:hypothetical protein
MTETEMSAVLGMLNEPVRNRVQCDPLMVSELIYLKHIFAAADTQKKMLGPVNPDLWCEFLPWHSLN